jgi:GH24 family phage-related lysozyme (muramidase)
MRRVLLALAAILFLAGCGLESSAPPKARTTTVAPPAVTYIPPESSITPEGAKPVPPPVGLSLTLTNSQLVTPAVLRLLEQEEGYDRCAYWDPFGRVYTVGFGQTHIRGGGVPAGFCFASFTAAVDNLKYAVEHEGYLGAVVAVVGRSQPPGVYTGEISFDYNLGAGIYQGQLRVDLERHLYRAACAIQRQYDHAGGVVLADLARRRIRECDAILQPAPRPAPKPPSPSALRRKLQADLRLRTTLRALEAKHRCRNPPERHTRPSTAAYRHACYGVWVPAGRRVNVAIIQLQRALA